MLASPKVVPRMVDSGGAHQHPRKQDRDIGEGDGDGGNVDIAQKGKGHQQLHLDQYPQPIPPDGLFSAPSVPVIHPICPSDPSLAAVCLPACLSMTHIEYDTKFSPLNQCKILCNLSESLLYGRRELQTIRLCLHSAELLVRQQHIRRAEVLPEPLCSAHPGSGYLLCCRF